jgi:hypothetical protein
MSSRPDPILMADGKEEYAVQEVLDQWQRNGQPKYLVRWKDYGPEDDTWELEENLGNVKEVLADFQSWGQDSEEVGYHVMAVTKSANQEPKANWTKPGLIKIPAGLRDGTSQQGEPVIGEQDSGINININDINTPLMGKLCRRALVLIKHKVGADVCVSNCMVRALEEWLQRWGITIYTEWFL